MNVAYQGPLKDYSGYGEANRHAVAALHQAGARVIAKSVTYSMESSDFGQIGLLMNDLMARKDEYAVKILHTTPDEYHKFLEDGKYHIGHFFWETDRVPEPYAEGLKKVDEIWTGSQANKDAIVKAGVNKPIYIFPQAFEINRDFGKPYEISDFNGYLFYSIFEWTERKNPLGLLRAYYSAFKPDDNVGLVIKTYFQNFTLKNKRMIRQQVEHLKSELRLEKTPPVFLYLELMDRSQIGRLHATGDCFVSAHRGEGWGIPQVEAAWAKNPVISTNYGGCHEYFQDQKNAHLIPFAFTKVRGMDHSAFYTSEQNWAEPDQERLQEAMRACYDDRDGAKQIGTAGRNLVKTRFNLKRVGDEMLARLKTIEKEVSADAK